MAKSQFRTRIEKVFTNAGVHFSNRAYIDNSKSGKRIKFVRTQLSDGEIILIRKHIRNEFPHNDIRVWHVNTTCYSGIAVKVFNNSSYNHPTIIR